MVSLAKRELHRLVDSLPDRETQAVKRFMEFVLARSDGQEILVSQDYVTLEQAAPALGLSVRRIRYLVREGVIPAHKEGGRWLIATARFQELLTPEAREFLSRPMAKDDLTEEEKAHSDGAWQRHLAGQSTPLKDLLKAYRDEPTTR